MAAPKYALPAGGNVQLGGSRARDVVFNLLPTYAETVRFSEALIASLRPEHYVGTKTLDDPPYPGEYDEYCLPLPAELVDEFELEPGDWYVAFKETRNGIYCISMHPSTKTPAPSRKKTGGKK